MNWNDVEGRGCGLIGSTAPECVWKDWEKRRNFRIVGCSNRRPSEFKSRALPIRQHAWSTNHLMVMRRVLWFGRSQLRGEISSEANSCSAMQEIPGILWNRDHGHKSLPLVRKASQLDYALHRISLRHDLLCIILQSTPRPSRWSPSFGLSDQNVVCICLMPQFMLSTNSEALRYAYLFRHRRNLFRLLSGSTPANVFSGSIGQCSSLHGEAKFHILEKNQGHAVM